MRRGLPGTLARLGALAMLVVSGLYLVVYLYRWEWNRALVAGVFFLASEIAVVGMAVLDRLATVARSDRGAAAPPPSAAPTNGSGNGGSGIRFPWLDPGRFSVFVPVLLGAGVLLSLVAWLVERLARATAPAGPSPLLARLGESTAPAASRARRANGGPVVRPRLGSLSLRLAAVAVVAVLLTVTLRFLADQAQARYEPPDPGRALLIDIEVRTRRATEPLSHLVDQLSLLCVPDAFDADVVVTGERTARLRVTPAPGRTDRRILHGCLEDLVLERTLVSVVGERAVELGQPPVAVDPGPAGTVHS
jgi:hypothetical protein